MSFWSNMYGSKPTVPDLPRLDLGQEQKWAIGENIGALPSAEKLVDKTNVFTRGQIDQMLKSAIPGYESRMSDIWGALGKEVRGELPLSDKKMSELRSVAKAFSGGFAGTPAMGNLVARDLGLTELGVVQKGIDSTQQWLGTMASIYEPSMLNVTSMFVNPTQKAAFDVNERNMQWEKDWLSSQVQAMADPVVKGQFQFGSQLFGSILSGALGGGGGMLGGLGGGMGGMMGGGGGGFSLSGLMGGLGSGITKVGQ